MTSVQHLIAAPHLKSSIATSHDPKPNKMIDERSMPAAVAKSHNLNTIATASSPGPEQRSHFTSPHRTGTSTPHRSVSPVIATRQAEFRP